MKLRIKLFKKLRKDKKVRIIFLFSLIVVIFIISMKFSNDLTPFIYFNF